jgi:hypothetical protein
VLKKQKIISLLFEIEQKNISCFKSMDNNKFTQLLSKKRNFNYSNYKFFFLSVRKYFQKLKNIFIIKIEKTSESKEITLINVFNFLLFTETIILEINK